MFCLWHLVCLDALFVHCEARNTVTKVNVGEGCGDCAEIVGDQKVEKGNFFDATFFSMLLNNI
jgi:hypothetical protein